MCVAALLLGSLMLDLCAWLSVGPRSAAHSPSYRRHMTYINWTSTSISFLLLEATSWKRNMIAYVARKRLRTVSFESFLMMQPDIQPAFDFSRLQWPGTISPQ